MKKMCALAVIVLFVSSASNALAMAKKQNFSLLPDKVLYEAIFPAVVLRTCSLTRSIKGLVQLKVVNHQFNTLLQQQGLAVIMNQAKNIADRLKFCGSHDPAVHIFDKSEQELDRAAKDHNIPLLKILLTIPGLDKDFPLFKHFFWKKVVAEFLAAGANVRGKKDEDGNSIFHKLALYPHDCDGAIKFFIDADLPVDVQNNDGNYPLHVAAKAGKLTLVKALLATGAPVNARNNKQMTPLHYAVQQDTIEVIDELLKAGAYVGARDKNNCMPLHLVLSNKNRDVTTLRIIKILLKACRDADIDISSPVCRRLMMLGVINRHGRLL